MKLPLLTLLLFLSGVAAQAQRQMEYLSRGLVAVQVGQDSVFVSWRLLHSDDENLAFNVYRKTGENNVVKLNENPLTDATSIMDVDNLPDGTYTYLVKPVVNGSEKKADGTYQLEKSAEGHPYFTIPMQTPENYSPGDASAADLDGDGDYELVVHMTGRGHDNSHNGLTDEPIFHAYKLDGTLLWSINLGKNVREGAHYTQFLVYDFNGDGRAEVAMKTADGTTDGTGKVIGDAKEDHRNENGHVLEGPEFLTVFDGMTGAALATVPFAPARHSSIENPTPRDLNEVWGDGRGNRSERYLACVAYLDGIHPSIVMCRGYYTRATLAAFDWQNDKLTQRWLFDSDDGTPGNRAYHGQGNHSVSVGDVDGDGCDEIIYGAAVINNDGTGLYSTQLGHADALHFSDLDPTRPGLEVFNIQERFDDAGMNFRDAKTGEILWKVPSVKAAESGGDKGEGPGRGVAFNVDPRYPGNECWAFGAEISGMWNAQGEKISETTPGTCNFAVWWDGDLLRELLDKNRVMKWDWENKKLNTIVEAENCWSNNGTKSTPALSADLFGDWREEVVLRTRDNQSLRIYTTTIPTEHRFVTLMQDPIYRLSIAWQNIAYNQPPHPGFYIGDEMERPSNPELNLIKYQPKSEKQANLIIENKTIK
ncbi:rhamnogalacturonan lyase [Mangrovibacterium lignilyticum]|uniref:rhamnogalacturonan lyase n=1 Tax=Mangrovibacterium lignilyticum TaxID=2668052 RepID=UPI0019683D3F|nr:rhamnogalacturonan lyase [Mangrovibacterium lignilyticum]